MLAACGGKLGTMKKIKNLKELQIDESYVVFVGYDYSPSGFDIGTFNLAGEFELQGNWDRIGAYECKYIYSLPPIEV
jgi:hypothetical protein